MVVVAGHIREHPWLMTWQRCRWSSWNLLLHVNFIISRMVQVDETTDRARRFQPVLVPLPVERWLPHVMVTSLELANRTGLVIPKDDFPFRWATLFFGAFPNPTTYFNQLAKHLIVVSFQLSYKTQHNIECLDQSDMNSDTVLQATSDWPPISVYRSSHSELIYSSNTKFSPISILHSYHWSLPIFAPENWLTFWSSPKMVAKGSIFRQPVKRGWSCPMTLGR